MRPRIGFSSVLGKDYLEDLERLMFYNPQQSKALKGIHDSVQEYGVPSIVEDGDRLRIQVKSLSEAQALFALEDSTEAPRLIGVMVYARVDVDNIVVLHIAVHEEYSQSGSRADAKLVWKFITQLRQIAKRIKGIRSVNMKYIRGLTLPL